LRNTFNDFRVAITPLVEKKRKKIEDKDRYKGQAAGAAGSTPTG
jgi:hypothetical protein